MKLFNYDNISWNLPLMFCHDNIIFALKDLLQDFKDVKRPTLYAYGSITSPWSGGRCTYTKFFYDKFLENHLNRIIDAGFIPNFTFTKPYIKKETLTDKVSNWILDYGVEHGCEFLVCDDKLFDHIKSRHPEAKVSASILKSKMEFHNPNKKSKHTQDFELNFYNDLIDKYDRVVVRPEFAIKDLVKDIDKIKDVSKLEVHLNETCLPNCPYAIKCYCSMDKCLEYDNFVNERCGRQEFFSKNSFKKNMEYSIMVKKDLIDDLVFKYGIKHLKIQGRHYAPDFAIILILYYLFDLTGNFRTVLPYLINNVIKYYEKFYSIPVEQSIICKQFFRDYCGDLL